MQVPIISLIILFYMGGMANTFLGVLACRNWERIGYYGCLFMVIYWLPLGIECLFDRKDRS